MFGVYSTNAKLEIVKEHRNEGRFLVAQPFTPIKLISAITSQLDIQSEYSIGVLYTIEWAIYLKTQGVTNITLMTENEDPVLKKHCSLHGFEYIMLARAKELNMKFDAVVGNPPYQLGKDKTFYQKFISQAFELAPVVAMITPSGWVSFSGKGKSFFNKVVNAGITHYKFLGNSAFKGVQILTVYFICNRNKSGNNVVVNDQTVNMPVITHLPSGSTGITAIIKKVKLLGDQNPLVAKIGSLYRKDAIDDVNGIRCIFSSGRQDKDYDWKYVSAGHATNGKVVGLGLHKVIFSGFTSIGKLGPTKYAPPKYGCAAQCLYVIVNNKQEAEHLIKYLNSKLFRVCLMEMKSSVCSTSRRMLTTYPMLDLTKEWSDADLYKHFNLTQDEIDYVEINAK